MSRWGRLVEATGFGNGKGQLSFNKSVTFTALWAWVAFLGGVGVLAWYGKPFPPAPLVAVVAGVCGVIIGAGFGLKGFLGAMKKGAPTNE